MQINQQFLAVQANSMHEKNPPKKEKKKKKGQSLTDTNISCSKTPLMLQPKKLAQKSLQSAQK